MMRGRDRGPLHFDELEILFYAHRLEDNFNSSSNSWNILSNFPSFFQAEKSRMLYSISCSVPRLVQRLSFQLSSSATGYKTECPNSFSNSCAIRISCSTQS